MPNPVWIRKYLTDRGYADNQVGFDGSRNEVTLKGKDFYGATPNADGLTYGDQGDLDKALASYNTSQNQTQLKSVSDSMVQKAQTAPTPFQAAPQLQAPPPVQNFTPPPAYAGFDAENNAAYQAALRRAGANAQTATGNAMADLNKRGILNSTIAGDRATQLQQKEFSNVSDTILPQLMQQDYGQYRDGVGDSRYADTTNYNRTQDAFKNGNDVAQSNFNNRLSVDKANYGLSQDQMSSLNSVAQFLSGNVQQDKNNQRLQTQDESKKQMERLALADQLSKEYGIQVSPKDDPALVYEQVKGLDPLALQEFKQKMAIQEAGVTGKYNGEPTYQASQAAIKNEQVRQAAQAKNSSPSASQTRINNDQASKGFEGDVMNELSQLNNEADVTEWLRLNQGEIAKQLGTARLEKIKKSALAAFQNGNKAQLDAGKQQASIRSKAIALAKSDPDWYDESKREGIIQEYMNVLTGK